MKIKVLSFGHKCSGWAKTAKDNYIKRLPKHLETHWLEIPVDQSSQERAHKDINKKAKPHLSQGQIIALDRLGQRVDSQSFADQLMNQRQVTFVIGAAHGLPKELLQASQLVWSLSDLIFPHAMVHAIVAEQIYRSSTLLSGHPYHKSLKDLDK